MIYTLRRENERGENCLFRDDNVQGIIFSGHADADVGSLSCQ